MTVNKQYGITIRHDVTARTKCLANRNFAWVVDIEWSSRTIDITYKTDRFTTTFAHRDGARWERQLCIDMTNSGARRLIAEIVPLVAQIADAYPEVTSRAAYHHDYDATTAREQSVAQLLDTLDEAVWMANETAMYGIWA